MFGVLVLVVIFTLLGVGAISLSNRETKNSGSMLDIKSRQSASYAGLVFALGEFQRDPVNFAALLEAWRTKTVYGGASNPLPRLYFRFDPAGGPVTLTKTKPASFQIPGSNYGTLVELAGIRVPSTASENPVVVLRATGTGRSGDEQTVLGAYRVANLRLIAQAGPGLPITHPFYLNGKATWNNKIEAAGGDVFFGNTVNVNSAAQEIAIASGGLRINGDLVWNTGKSIDVAGNSWITGTYVVKSGTGPLLFRGNLIIDNNMTYSGVATVDVLGSVMVHGAGGLLLQSGTLNVGAGVPGSQIVVDGGMTQDNNGNGTLNVVGSAYLRHIGNSTKAWTLNASRLELSDNPGLSQQFFGSGTWGKLVARRAAPLSLLRPKLNMGISIATKSWNENASNLSLGTAFSRFNQAVGATVHYAPLGPCTGCAGLTATSATAPGPADSISTVAYGGAGVDPQGFDAAYPPKTLAQLGYDITPTTETEVGFDLTKDLTIEPRAFVPGPSGGLCLDNAKLCGAYIQAQYSNPSNAGCFYNGFFVVLLNGTRAFTWDAGGAQTTPLTGKYLFIVTAPNGARIWPTTAANADPAHPTNVQFIYVKSTGKIFNSFTPRYKSDATPVTFYGYVRIEHPGTLGVSWDVDVPVDFQGAVHVIGDRTNVNLIVNSSSTGSLKFNLNTGTLDAIGAAFGKCFTDPTTGAPLASGATAGFQATESWIQFRTIAELR